MRTAGRGSRARGDGSDQSGARTESDGNLQSILRHGHKPALAIVAARMGISDHRRAGCDWHCRERPVAWCRPNVHITRHSRNRSVSTSASCQ